VRDRRLHKGRQRNARNKKPRVKPQNNRPKRVRNKKPLRGPRPRNRRVFKPKPRCVRRSASVLRR
jgi:hypothetical protein